MIDNLIQNQGIVISSAGLIVTFLGLALVAVTIYLFNIIFSFMRKSSQDQGVSDSHIDAAGQIVSIERIPEEELVAIAVAIDIYRRIHFDAMQSDISFEKGDPQTPWKMVYKYGPRFQKMR
jgi:hypothetical protein